MALAALYILSSLSGRLSTVSQIVHTQGPKRSLEYENVFPGPQEFPLLELLSTTLLCIILLCIICHYVTHAPSSQLKCKLAGIP